MKFKISLIGARTLTRLSVGEWKAKADDLMAELDAAHSEARNYSNERFRLKSALDESNEQLDIVRRENKVMLSHYLLVYNA